MIPLLNVQQARYRSVQIAAHYLQRGDRGRMSSMGRVIRPVQQRFSPVYEKSENYQAPPETLSTTQHRLLIPDGTGRRAHFRVKRVKSAGIIVADGQTRGRRAPEFVEKTAISGDPESPRFLENSFSFPDLSG